MELRSCQRRGSLSLNADSGAVSNPVVARTTMLDLFLGYTYCLMKRFFVLLLLTILPLQFALAGAVDAFAHAGNGHSEQSHAAVADLKAATMDADDYKDDASPRCHGECGTCHFFHSLVLFGSRVEALSIASAPAVLSPSSTDHQNRVTALRPERPKWLQLA
jgi:hypothetical protein